MRLDFSGPREKVKDQIADEGLQADLKLAANGLIDVSDADNIHVTINTDLGFAGVTVHKIQGES